MKNLLKAKWSVKEKDIMIWYPNKRDGSFLSYFLTGKLLDGKSLWQELEDRGYDITTLKFSIEKKADSPLTKALNTILPEGGQ